MTVISKNDNLLIDGERAIFTEIKSKVTADQTAQGVPVILHISNYEVFYENYIIDIGFSVGSINDTKELLDLYNEYKAFFKIIAHSFVLDSKWL